MSILTCPNRLLAVLALALAAMRPAAGSELSRYEFSQRHMGVDFRLVLYAPDEATANRAAAAAYGRVAELNSLLSDYLDDSELTRLSNTAGQGGAVQVSDEMWHVLTRSQQLAQRTEGAFDITVGPVVRLWRRARRQRRLPKEERLHEELAAVGYEKLLLNEQQQTAELTVPGMRLDLGGIAKGYAADEALQTLREHGATSALIDASGDIVIGDAPPGLLGWQIGIAPLDAEQQRPTRFLLLANMSVATSGDAFQHVEVDGVRYSHLVDPHAGIGLTDQSSVTVLAPDGITSDSLASAVSVLGPEQGFELLAKIDNTAAFVARNENGEFTTHVSPRLANYELSVDRLAKLVFNKQLPLDKRLAAVNTLTRLPSEKLRRQALPLLKRIAAENLPEALRAAARKAL